MFEAKTQGTVETYSPIKAFLLSTFYGQRIVSKWYKPVFGCTMFTIYSVRFELISSSALT